MRFPGSEPQSQSHVRAADGARVLAIFGVAGFHIWQQSWLSPVLRFGGVTLDFNAPVRAGYCLVDALLVLTGFLLFLPCARTGRAPDARTFYGKRAARILPSYLLCVLGMLFFVALPGGEYKSALEMWRDIATHLTLTYDLFYDTLAGTRLNAALWTVAVEARFYLVFPLIARAFLKRPLGSFAVFALIGVLFRAFVLGGLNDTTLYLNRLIAQMDAFACGMFAAWALARLEKKRPETKWWEALLMTCAAILAAVCIWWILEGQSAIPPGEARRVGQAQRRFLLSACSALFVLCSSRGLRAWNGLLGNRVMRFLSNISYNFYIWHAVIALRLKAWGFPPSESAVPNQVGEQPWQSHYTFAAFALSLALAALVTYAFERPIGRLLVRRRSGSRA